MVRSTGQPWFVRLLWPAAALASAMLAYHVWWDWHEGTLALFPLGFFLALGIRRGLDPLADLHQQMIAAAFLMCLLVAFQMIHHGFVGTLDRVREGINPGSSSDERRHLLRPGLILAFIGVVGCASSIMRYTKPRTAEPPSER